MIYRALIQCIAVKLLVGLTVAILLVSAGSVFAGDRGPLQKGLLLMQAEKYEDAAKTWQADAEKLAGVGEDQDRTDAGVRYVLATIAYDKFEDARAYGTWAKAIEIFLRAGSDWPTERDHLKQEIDESRAALVSMLNGEAATLKTNGSDLSLVNIDAFVGLTKFDGPRRNLKSIDTPKEADIEGGRAYIAKPLALQRSLPSPQNSHAENDEDEDQDSAGEQNEDPPMKNVGADVVPRQEDEEMERLRRAFAPRIKKASAAMVPTAAEEEKPPSKKKRVGPQAEPQVEPVKRIVPAPPDLKGTIDVVGDSNVANEPEMPPHRGLNHK